MTTILVIDDHPTNRQLLVTLLGYRNYRVLEASDGAEGLAVARAERPDLIIADILMPVMDGYEFARQIRANSAVAQTQIVFYTATYLEAEARELARACGVDYLITKPSEPQDILATVEAALQSPPPVVPSTIPEKFEHDHRELLTSKLAQKVDELEIVNQRLAALIELGQQLATERDTSRLLGQYCDAARQIIGAKYAVVAILDDEQILSQVFTSGLDAETSNRLQSLPADQEVLEEVLVQQRPFRWHDSDASTINLSPEHPPVRSFLGVPIASAAQLYGLLYLADKLGMAQFSEEEAQVAVALAAQMAVAYENAQWYAEIQAQAAKLRQEIAERRRAEEALRAKNEELTGMTQQLWQAAKLATMGELAASVAHELNNPLAIISLRIESLLAQLTEDDPGLTALQVVEAEVERMGKLVAELLHFGRRSQPQISTVDVRQEVDNALQFMQYHMRNRSIEVVQEFPTDPLMIQADRQQLRQLFLNLLTNASDAMPEGGTLTVRIFAGSLNDAVAAVIEFVDTGMGIAPDDLERVWESFFTTKSEGKGTGLGLAICRRVAQEHGGTIEIFSQPDRGTRVQIRLPAKSHQKNNLTDEEE
jgi:signal transduction histidine kinase/CheY-like chemotaxis protein